MRRTTLALAATTAGLAALVGLKSQSAGAPRSALAASPGHQEPAAPASPSSPSTSSSTSSSSSSSTTAAAPASGSFTGSAIASQYGTTQVRAVISGGRLTDVVVLQQTDVGQRSTQIDSYAVPVLKAEALSAQSADIDVVSGATYTSAGYASSLQAALDAAGR